MGKNGAIHIMQGGAPEMPGELPEQPCCGHCLFYMPGAGGVPGQCRRNPPQVVMVPAQNKLTREVGLELSSFAPPVGVDYLCGEFLQHPESTLNIKPEDMVKPVLSA